MLFLNNVQGISKLLTPNENYYYSFEQKNRGFFIVNEQLSLYEW